MKKTKQQRNFPTGQGGDPLLATLTEEKGLGLTQGDLEEMGDIGMKENLKRLEQTDSLLEDPQFASLLSEFEIAQRLNSKPLGGMEAMLKDPRIDIAADLLKLAHSVLVTVQKISGEDEEITKIIDLLDGQL